MFALDTPWNSAFGLFVVFWGTIYVESWKKTQALIQHQWDCSDSSFKRIDERTEQYKYFKIYNEFTGRTEKESARVRKRETFMYNSSNYILIIAVVVAMIGY